jgi:hypothetical protein
MPSPRYRVEVPFRAANNGRLPELPYQLPDGAIIDRQIRPDERPEAERPTQLSKLTKTFSPEGTPLEVERPPAESERPQAGGYRYCVMVKASCAEEAVARAEGAAKDLLAALAARQMAFEVESPARRYTKRLDPPTDPVPDTELPFDTVNMSNRDPAWLAKRYDPTGERRRQGIVFSSVAEAAVDRAALTIDAELYAGHERWDDRLRRAAETYRLAQCSKDEVVRFLLCCLVLEVLVEHDRTAIISSRFATKSDRKKLISELDEVLAAAGLVDQDLRERVINRVRDAEVQSYTTSAAEYLNELELSIPPKNLAWVQAQRGGFVHSGKFDEFQEAAVRRNEFVKIVGVVVQREMARFAGRSFDGLEQAVTFSWLQVWDFGDEELTLRPG